jgi:hypothetical protein
MKSTRTVATKVTICWSENRSEGLPASFPNFREADQLLKEMAKTAPEGGGYNKTGFEVIFEDGEKYEGRFDLKRKHESGGPLIEDHILGHLNFYAGRIMADDLPSHLTPEKYREVLIHLGEKKRDECIRLIDHYRIGDGTAPSTNAA